MSPMDPIEVRNEAERLIGEDRVPTSVLQDIVDQFGDEPNDVDSDHWNAVVEEYAEYARGEADEHGHGKRVPYIGWAWRTVDFASDYISIGHCEQFVGFMENNKWGYAERSLTPDEANQVRAVVREAVGFHDDGDPGAAKALLAGLWPLLQSFPMTVEGFWIYGPQGQVAFADTEEGADQMIAALSSPGGFQYRKVATSEP